jgi:hypothetical protein
MPPTSSTVAKPVSDDHEILFQTWFKSVGPRTYATQVKVARNGNHYVAITEGRRDEKTGEVRKNRVFVYSEDFVEFFKMLHEAAVFIRENPMSADMKEKRDRYWSKQHGAEPDRSPKPLPQDRKSHRPPAAAADKRVGKPAGRSGAPGRAAAHN